MLLDDRLVVKIADFGLSRHVQSEENFYIVNTCRKLPVKWMSLEALSEKTFSTASDVLVLVHIIYLVVVST